MGWDTRGVPSLRTGDYGGSDVRIVHGDVALRRSNGGVPEQRLHEPQVVCFVVYLRRAQVAELVHRGSVTQGLRHQRADPVGGEMPTLGAGEEVSRFRGPKSIGQPLR